MDASLKTESGMGIKQAHSRTISGALDALDQAIEGLMRTQEIMVKMLEPITNPNEPSYAETMKDPGEVDLAGAPLVDSLFSRVAHIHSINRQYSELLSSVKV